MKNINISERWTTVIISVLCTLGVLAILCLAHSSMSHHKHHKQMKHGYSKNHSSGCQKGYEQNKVAPQEKQVNELEATTTEVTN